MKVYQDLTIEDKLAIITEAREIIIAVPSEEFITQSFAALAEVNGKEKLCGCTVGHYIMRKFEQNNISFSKDDVHLGTIAWDGKVNNIIADANYLTQIATEFVSIKYRYINIGITKINDDNIYNGYRELVIKDRVMHLLNDMSAWLQKQMEENGINK